MAKGIITFRLDGVQDAINRLAKVGGQVAEDVEDELAAGANDIIISAERNLQRQDLFVSGNLAGSRYAKQIAPLRFEVGFNAFHAPFIEFGTRGKVQIPPAMQEIAAKIKTRRREKEGKFKDMVLAILEWGGKKGLWDANDKKSKGRAFMMARSIYRNGIASQPFLYPAYVENRSKIIERIKKIVEKPR
jgi:hypothetical protein